MQIFLFSPDAIPGATIEIVKKIDLIDPETAQVTPGTVPVKILDITNGYIGVFPHETKLQINLEVKGEHKCYVLAPKTKERIAKREDSPGKYTKNFTVSWFQDKYIDEDGHYYNKSNELHYSGIEGSVAQWPANMICLEIPGHTYNIGLMNHNGRFFFVIEEYLPSPENLLEGMVVQYSLLRGIGTVAYKPMFDARIHWTNVPINRRIGLRLLQTGDLLKWQEQDLVDLSGDTSFRYEIKRCVNLSTPK